MAKLIYNENDSHLIECMLKVAMKSLQNTLGKDFSTEDMDRTKEILKDMENARTETIKESGSTSKSLDCEDCDV